MKYETKKTFYAMRISVIAPTTGGCVGMRMLIKMSVSWWILLVEVSVKCRICSFNCQSLLTWMSVDCSLMSAKIRSSRIGSWSAFGGRRKGRGCDGSGSGGSRSRSLAPQGGGRPSARCAGAGGPIDDRATWCWRPRVLRCLNEPCGGGSRPPGKRRTRAAAQGPFCGDRSGTGAVGVLAGQCCCPAPGVGRGGRVRWSARAEQADAAAGGGA